MAAVKEARQEMAQKRGKVRSPEGGCTEINNEYEITRRGKLGEGERSTS